METLTSPLKVRERKRRVWAENSSKVTVIDGRLDQTPDLYSCTGPSGVWRIAPASGGYVPVYDPAGREAARITSTGRNQSEIQLSTGERAAVDSRGGFITGFRCTIGDWATARAPRFAPQRYFSLTLSDAVLARPDAELIAVIATWMSETKIASLITKANMSS